MMDDTPRIMLIDTFNKTLNMFPFDVMSQNVKSHDIYVLQKC